MGVAREKRAGGTDARSSYIFLSLFFYVVALPLASFALAQRWKWCFRRIMEIIWALLKYMARAGG